MTEKGSSSTVLYICGQDRQVVGRASDIARHMKWQDQSAKFVLLFSNLLIVIDTYFIGDSRSDMEVSRK